MYNSATFKDIEEGNYETSGYNMGHNMRNIFHSLPGISMYL